MAAGCAIMDYVMTPETEARIVAAADRYAKADAERKAAHADLVAAMSQGKVEDPTGTEQHRPADHRSAPPRSSACSTPSRRPASPDVARVHPASAPLSNKSR